MIIFHLRNYFDDYIPFEKLTKTVLTINENGVFLNEAYLTSIINQQSKTNLFVIGNDNDGYKEITKILDIDAFSLTNEEALISVPSNYALLSTFQKYNIDQNELNKQQSIEIAKNAFYIENIMNLKRGSGIWYTAAWDENSQSIIKVEEYDYDYGFGILADNVPPLLMAMEDSAQHKIDETWTTWGMSHIADNSDFMDGIRIKLMKRGQHGE